MSGLVIEAATEHVEILVAGSGGEPLAHETEDVGHGHTRRLAPLVRRALERAGIGPRALEWVAADLGPGSFTGVRVGLATAHAIALVARAEVLGASSLAALALASGVRRALVVPLLSAGRRDLYAGYFRADVRGAVHLLAAPRVGPAAEVLAGVREATAALERCQVRFFGPGVPRERARLEEAYPGSTVPAFRHEGLSAVDLAHAARSRRGPAAGLPVPGQAPRPLYVRPAQAEERVRRRANAAEPMVMRDFRPADVPAVAAVERRVFSDPWPESFFIGELESPMMFARIAERDGRLAGYSLAWIGHGSGHLGNLAVVPEMRRRGAARALLDDLLTHARALNVDSITLEVRVSNFAAQGLYRCHGFRMVGLRRRYYRDTGEDALVMEWRASASAEQD